MPYLHRSLVTKRHWIDDKEFVELSISQSLPGLNATNMAVLVGEKLRGMMGAIAGLIGICLPGGVLMVSIVYHHHGDHAFITAALKGVAAEAVGLILSTVVSLSKNSLFPQLRLRFHRNDSDCGKPVASGRATYADRGWDLGHSVPSSAQSAESECDAMNQIPALIRVFSYLSILTVGGGMAAFPEMKILTVDVHHWLNFAQLIHLYSIGQMAPGPNMMMIVSIGQWAGGTVGAIAVVIAFFGPTAILTFVVARAWRKLEKWPWRTSIQQGLAPVSIGLLLAGCFSLARGAIASVETAGLAVAVLLILLQYKVNPALLVLASAGVGLLIPA